ncbi:PREDICTED: defensin-like protein 125 [Camelina sativa]|uniref:Defensin-like protein 125 n=1 Tax=Camelina sativa TaxID=90675 RepID=A0ABM1RPZ4_CAMSA|nr:PREDICTED: defensin-like protein 125 [Camelina sativa]
MTKAITLAIFMVILVLGMVTKETQGGEVKKCYSYIITPKENCESLICAYECTRKYNGFGECYDTTSTTCICAHNCNI